MAARTERRRRNKPVTLHSGCLNPLPNDATTYFLPITGIRSNVVAPPTNAYVLIPRAGLLKNFYTYLDVAPGGVTSRSFFVYVNGAPVALTTVYGAAVNGLQSDLANVIAVAVGDRVCIQMVPAGGNPAASNFSAGVEFWST